MGLLLGGWMVCRVTRATTDLYLYSDRNKGQPDSTSWRLEYPKRFVLPFEQAVDILHLFGR